MSNGTKKYYNINRDEMYPVYDFEEVSETEYENCHYGYVTGNNDEQKLFDDYNKAYSAFNELRSKVYLLLKDRRIE